MASLHSDSSEIIAHAYDTDVNGLYTMCIITLLARQVWYRETEDDYSTEGIDSSRGP